MMVKCNKFFLWGYLASINFSICTQTRPNCNKNCLCLAKHFTRTNRILNRHACADCDKFHVCQKIFCYKQNPSLVLVKQCLSKGHKKALAKGQSPPQGLEVVSLSVLYFKKLLNQSLRSHSAYLKLWPD